MWPESIWFCWIIFVVCLDKSNVDLPRMIHDLKNETEAVIAAVERHIIEKELDNLADRTENRLSDC